MSLVPGKLILHRMGYYSDQAGIMRRYRAEEPSWALHIKKTRELILRVISLFNPPAVTVLGSGWLLDLPLDEMMREDRKITLVDILIPEKTKTLIASLSNVRFIKEDVTGGLIESVYDCVHGRLLKHRADVKKILSFRPYMPPSDAGLVISLNLLTQLDSLPVEYLKRKTIITVEQIQQIRHYVHQQHIDMLMKRDSLLITDFYEHPVSAEDKTEGRLTVAADLPAGFIREEWDWTFDTRRSYNPSATTVFRVAGIALRR